MVQSILFRDIGLLPVMFLIILVSGCLQNDEQSSHNTILSEESMQASLHKIPSVNCTFSRTPESKEKNLSEKDYDCRVNAYCYYKPKQEDIVFEKVSAIIMYTPKNLNDYSVSKSYRFPEDSSPKTISQENISTKKPFTKTLSLPCIDSGYIVQTLYIE